MYAYICICAYIYIHIHIYSQNNMGKNIAKTICKRHAY